MAVPFDIQIQSAGERVSVISVRGELDLATAPQLKWALVDLTESGCRRIVLDFTELDFIDSTALGVLIAARRNAPQGTRLAIASARRAVHHILEVTGLDASLDILDTVGEACELVERGAERAA